MVVAPVVILFPRLYHPFSITTFFIYNPLLFSCPHPFIPGLSPNSSPITISMFLTSFFPLLSGLCQLFTSHSLHTSTTLARFYLLLTSFVLKCPSLQPQPSGHYVLVWLHNSCREGCVVIAVHCHQACVVTIVDWTQHTYLLLYYCYLLSMFDSHDLF